MKVNDRMAESEMTTEFFCRRKKQLRHRGYGDLGKNTAFSDASANVTLSESQILPTCHCFGCVPIRHIDSKWAELFQCPELNAATRVAWFLPPRLRNFFSSTAKGAFISYKMGLPPLCRICTVISVDGLHYHHMYRAAWVMRLYDQAFDFGNCSLFPRTIFGGIARFLDFAEINTVSMTYTYMRCYIKSEMNQLRCFKIQDRSDMSNMFCVLKGAVKNYNLRYLPITTCTGLILPGLCKYSNDTLALLAGMDRIYERDFKSQFAVSRRNPEGRYRFILQKMFNWYIEPMLLFDEGLVSVRIHPVEQREHVNGEIVGEIVVDSSLFV